MTESVRPQHGLDRLEPYVPGKPIDEVKREYGLDDVIKLASNENPLGASPKALEAIAGAMSSLNLYPDGQSHDLRQALAAHFEVPFDQVAVGNGADDLILQLSMAYLEDDDEVVVSRSSFGMYDVYVHAMRAKLIKTPLAPGYRIDLDAAADAITDRTKLVYVCNPNNPTGTMSTAEEVDRFLERLPNRVLCVMDEAYCEMVESNDYPDTLAMVRSGRPNVLVLRTFSKVYGIAGIRLGYGFGHAEVIGALAKVRAAFTVNSLAQAAGIAALKDDAFLRQSIETNREGRQQLCNAFDHLGLEHAESHTNFVLVRLGPAALDVAEALLRRGIIVRPMTTYQLPEFLRISIGTSKQNARLIGALEELLPLRDAQRSSRQLPSST
jgi:histidinol-phosphate aminotransferase